MIIAIDFDGTCVTHDFPAVGKEIGAVPILKRLVAAGHQLILFTMRSDMIYITHENPGAPQGGLYLTNAINWFKNHDIPLHGINKNPDQLGWTSSPKAYAQMYIDDAALGCPLLLDKNHDRPYVDWASVEKLLEDRRVLPFSTK